MDDDSPQSIAIIGAGPIGVEAALYARYLGYRVALIERGRVGEHLLRWGHVRMFTPFGMNATPLGLAALAAQDPSYQPPPADALLTGRELVEAYLLPLAHSDLVVDSLHLGAEVLEIHEDETDPAFDEDDEDDGVAFPLRLVMRLADGGEASYVADQVIDATGAYGQPVLLGPHPVAVPGEIEAADRIDYRLPDVAGRDRDLYAGQRTLVVGSGHSAATTILAFRALANDIPGTHFEWLVRRMKTGAADWPIDRVENDPLPERDSLAVAANALVASGQVVLHDSYEVLSIDRIGDELVVNLVHRNGERRPVIADRIVVRVGDRARQVARRWPEEALNFHVLGAKNRGVEVHFLLTDGHAQIRDLFAKLGGRAALDLYAGMKRQQTTASQGADGGSVAEESADE